MTKKTRNWLLALGILAFPFVLFLGCLIFMEESPPPLTPLPNPNGYDDFLKASQQLADNTGALDETNAAQLQKIVSADAAAVALARAGLSNQCRVQVQFSESYISNHLDDLAGIKRLARAFVDEGRLSVLEHRSADAAKSYLDTIRLANESSRGGTVIDELVGIAIEEVGTIHLRMLFPQLDANACRKTAAALETLNSQRQTWSEVMQQESTWSHGTFSGLHYDLMRLEAGKSPNVAVAACKRKFDAQEQKTRQLMIDLAARAYELDKGHPPASTADLVPDYLKAVPQDPVTGTNMVYSPR
jgi:hypothetical protein